MTITHLEYFCAVCRCHSITRAAEELFVSQPTISIALKKLEDEFHLKLFVHGRNSISLTREGEAFYKKAELLLQQCQDMYTEFSELSTSNPPLKLAFPPLMSTVFFPRMIDAFNESCDIPVRLYEYASMRARDLIDSDELDIALVNMGYYNLEKYNNLPLMEDQTIYCVSKTHRYAKEKKITFEMLADEQIILLNTDSVLNDTIFSRFHSLNMHPDVKMYCSQLYTILNFVRGGRCGAFLYSSLAVNPRDFVQLPLDSPIYSSFGLIWKKDNFTPLRTTRFIEFAKKYNTSPYIPAL